MFSRCRQRVFRDGLVLVAALSFHAGCVPLKRSTEPDRIRSSAEEGIVKARNGDECSYWMIPTTDGSCHLGVQRYEGPIGSTQPTRNVLEVPCGTQADICGESRACDCSNPVEVQPCGDRDLEPIHRDVLVADGYRCDFKVHPPRLGECFVKGARMGTREGARGVADWFSVVPFGETLKVCGGRVEVSCVCSAFEVNNTR